MSEPQERVKREVKAWWNSDPAEYDATEAHVMSEAERDEWVRIAGKELASLERATVLDVGY